MPQRRSGQQIIGHDASAATFLKQSDFIISTGPQPPDIDDSADTSLAGETSAEVKQWQVPASEHGQRLDRALAVWLPEFSRSYLQQLITAGLVKCNGLPAGKASMKLRAADRLEIELRPTPQTQAFRPENMSLDIVFEDAHLLVVNKPAGLVVHPAPGNWSGTLLNGLLAHDARAVEVPRAGIVHRLDKDTSGLMVVARTRACMDELVRRIAAREVSRQYLAIGQGRWSGTATRRVDAPIGRDPRNRLRMAVVDLNVASGKTAATRIRLLDNGTQACLVECTLETGRTHQIRVHMGSLGHPLVSDVLYGAAPGAGLTRQALHARRLAFNHPMTGEGLVFRAPVPRDLSDAMQLLGLSYNDF